MKNNQNNLINRNNKYKVWLTKPIISYINADTQKVKALKENKKKTGIYRWINIESDKSYVGYSRDLPQRLKNYYNLSFLKLETKKK